MLAGFHAAGMLLHDPVTAIEELAQLGYRCVAIRPHAAFLNPSHSTFATQSMRMHRRVDTNRHAVSYRLGRFFSA